MHRSKLSRLDEEVETYMANPPDRQGLFLSFYPRQPEK
jgi:hypothetical protein